MTELLDRERVLLVSDLDDGTLEALRKRQNELLANYIGGEKLFDGTKGYTIFIFLETIKQYIIFI